MDRQQYLISAAALLLAGLVSLSGTAMAAAAQPTLTGSVAYGEPLAWDYDGDGTANQVQMWVEFHVMAPVGTEGESGFLPGKGTMRRYMKDLSTGKPVVGYGLKNMLPDTPMGSPIEVSDISLSGHTMTFTVESFIYTVTDGGPGYENDSITVNNGLEDYPVRLFAGDLTITGAK